MNNNNELDWVNFCRRTNDPKLTWIESQLKTLGIAHRRNGDSFHAPILQVPRDRFSEAWDLLNTPIGEMFVGEEKAICYDDLPDNHWFFYHLAVPSPEPNPLQAITPIGGVNMPYQPLEIDGRVVDMIDVESSTISAMGFWPVGDEFTDTSYDLYVRFKGGSLYKYNPVPQSLCWELRYEAEQRYQGHGGSVGRLFIKEVKNVANAGEMNCWKREGSMWIPIYPKEKTMKLV